MADDGSSESQGHITCGGNSWYKSLDWPLPDKKDGNYFLYKRNGNTVAQYDGPLVTGRPHGKDGIMVWLADGSQHSQYTGDWVRGNAQGAGVWKSSEGEMLNGTWMDGRPYGNCVFRDVSGRHFIEVWGEQGKVSSQIEAHFGRIEKHLDSQPKEQKQKRQFRRAKKGGRSRKGIALGTGSAIFKSPPPTYHRRPPSPSPSPAAAASTPVLAASAPVREPKKPAGRLSEIFGRLSVTPRLVSYCISTHHDKIL